jgi:hypothetical protein
MSNYAVICRTCLHNVYEGDAQPADGQLLLTAFADSVTGTACPSGIATCPHKSAALTARAQLAPATVADLAAVKARLDKVEKIKP